MKGEYLIWKCYGSVIKWCNEHLGILAIIPEVLKKNYDPPL